MRQRRKHRPADQSLQVANERLALPNVALFICFGALLVYPAAVRLTAGT